MSAPKPYRLTRTHDGETLEDGWWVVCRETGERVGDVYPGFRTTGWHWSVNGGHHTKWELTRTKAADAVWAAWAKQQGEVAP